MRGSHAHPSTADSDPPLPALHPVPSDMSRRQQRTYLFFVVVGLIVVCTNLYVAYSIRSSADAAQQQQPPATPPPPPVNADDDNSGGDSSPDSGQGGGGGGSRASSSSATNLYVAYSIRSSADAAQQQQSPATPPPPPVNADDDGNGNGGDSPDPGHGGGGSRHFAPKRHGGHGHNPVAHHGGRHGAKVEEPPETHRPHHSHRPRHHGGGHDEHAPVVGKAPEGDASSDSDGENSGDHKDRKHGERANNKHKNKIRDPAEMRDKRMAFAMPSNGFSEMTYDDAVKAYNENIATDIGTRVNQSSISFIDIVEDKHAGIRLPDTPIVAKSPYAPSSPNPQCDPLDNRFTPESDAACRAYLSDPANWESVKPMSSILSTGRTIKFRVFLRNGAAAVMKVPQNKFVLEPSSEVEAYETDRMLGFNRVPPVAWVSFPLKYLQAACGSKVLPAGTRQLPQEHQRKAFYSQWFQKFVVEYKQSAAALHHDHATKEQMLYVSLQIWMKDVHNADETALRPPPNYRSLMRADKPFPNDASNWTRAGVAELSDVSLFDFIIGNTDRWFGHNSFAFGGCDAATRPPPRCHNPPEPGKTIKGTPMYAFIDQGSSFYRSGPPDQTLYYGSKSNPTVDDLCRFRKSTAEAIVAVARLKDGRKDYYAEMQARLPRGIFAIGSKYLVKAGRTRLEHLAKMIEGCLEKHPREDVLYF
eukprot:CAMPEP_0174881856 /NCGR_PEP_ID=MMETSP1114-20130205/84469_1 /TAXON_ID=312471 /ORGANISM="Neobodo designis, Strain CCAP 1951/1" /LENGTH=699 /DNA_ID=CAMNT_0016117253 /DNA_START=84 /DNA_END=2182 /DNA_ORIENTATION=-